VLDQILLNGLAEDVTKTLNLRGVLVGDHGHLVAAVKDGTAPVGQVVTSSESFDFA